MLPTFEPALQEIMQLDPYELRRKGLHEPLTHEEFARILFHLSQRRGFKSSRKSGGTEEGVLFKGSGEKRGINELQNEIAEKGLETVGEYLAQLDSHEIRRRDRYLLRKDLMLEYDLLWQRQLVHHAEWEFPMGFDVAIRENFDVKFHKKILTINFPTFLRDYVIYYQRKLKSQKGLIGKCKFEPKSKRAAMSHFVAQEFRIWQKLHDIRLVGNDKTNEPLSFDEKHRAFDWLNTSDDKTFEQLLKYLKLDDYEINFRPKDKIKGNKTANEFLKVVGKNKWATLTVDDKNKMWRVLHDAEDNDWLINYGIEKWGLTETEAQKLTKISLENTYAELSQKAIKKILFEMKENNLDYTQACSAVGYHHSLYQENKTFEDFLPEPELKRNPIVQQGLYELRKVVNTIIEEYGAKPDIIRLELARELKMPKKKRESRLIDNKKRENERNEIFGILRDEFHLNNPSNDDVLKYQLWCEADKQCIYTGKYIGAEDLFSPAFEIEHIVPYSRSLDDSRMNKSLCFKSFNALKGNLLPYEMYEKGMITEQHYNEIIERAKGIVSKGAYNKFKRFIQRKVDTDMISRQLNDTALMAVEARKYLQTICPKVEVIAGQATAQLRHLWGLNSILNKHGLHLKNREDHRHHAIDAIVVGCTTPSMIQALSKLHEKGHKPTANQFPLPWDGFRRDVKVAVNDILVRYKIRKRARGGMHDETVAGAVLGFDKQQRRDEKGQPIFTVRKPLAAFMSAAIIDKIADPIIKKIVIERVCQHGVDLNNKKFKVPATAFLEPLYMYSKKGKKIPIKHIRIHDVASNKIEIRKGAFVDSGNNHHLVIFQLPNGRRDANVVSMFEAMQRKQKKQAVFQTEVGEGNTFVMTLQKGELVLINTDGFDPTQLDWDTVTNEELSPHLYRVQKMDVNKNLIFRHHLTSVLTNSEGEEVGMIKKTVNSFVGIKVQADTLGNIRPV